MKMILWDWISKVLKNPNNLAMISFSSFHSTVFNPAKYGCIFIQFSSARVNSNSSGRIYNRFLVSIKYFYGPMEFSLNLCEFFFIVLCNSNMFTLILIQVSFSQKYFKNQTLLFVKKPCHSFSACWSRIWLKYIPEC